MLNIDSLQNGIVIDHIKAGASMTIYDLLELGSLTAALPSSKTPAAPSMARRISSRSTAIST